MLASFLLSLREGLEAALIIGIVLSALYKINRQDLRLVVWRGAAIAAIVSLLAAVFLQLLGAEFKGRAEEIFGGIATLSAAVLLTWMILWMKYQAGSIQRQLETDVKNAAIEGSTRALFILAFLAVGREGLELALFLTASTLTSNAFQMILGAAVGLAASALLGFLLFATTRRLSLKQFFQVTNVLLILFAAGLVAHGIHEFNEAGLVPAIIEPVWDMNPVLNESSPLGQVLAALFGYNGNPSLIEVSAYLGYYALLWLLFAKNRRLVLRASKAARLP